MARYCRFPSPRAVLRSPFRIIMPAAIAALIILGASGTVSAQNTSSAVVPPAAAMRRGLSGPPSMSATRQRPTRTLNLAAQPKHGAPPPVVTLYENGPINGQVNAWPITSGAVVSDTFLMPSNATSITGLTFGAWLFPGDTMQSVEVSITSGPGSGTTYFDSIVDVTQASCFTNGFGDNVCSETAIFTILGLPAGNYWINLQNADVNTGDPAFWDQNSGVGCNSPGCPSMAQESQLGTIPSESFTLSGDLGNSTTTALLITPNPATAGQVVSLAATVNTSGSELVTIGTVTFFSGTQVLGTVQANDNGINTATLLTRFAPGSDTITAQYNGNRFFAESASAPQTLTVTGTEPTISTLSETPGNNNYNFTLSVFGFGFPPLSGSATLNNLTQGGLLLGNIDLAGPGMPTFQPQQAYPVGGGPNGVAVGDFNGDGIPDLAIVSSTDSTVSVLLGNSNGTFRTQTAFPVTSGPLGIAVGDVDGDGNLDLAVTSSQGVVDVLLGNGTGGFQVPQLYTVEGNPQQVVIADFNEDGIPDLAVTNGGENTVSVLLGVGNGTFGTQTAFPVGGDPEGIVVGDFNRDGIPDLAVVNHEGSDSSVSVLLGNGDGTFQTQQKYPIGSGSDPTAIATADFKGNGITDLVVSTNTAGVAVLLGNGDGTFQPAQTYPAGSLPDGIAVADFNGDGVPDVVVADLMANNINILLGNSNGSLQSPQPYAAGLQPLSVAAADFNGDGVPDVAAVNTLDDTASVLLGGTVSTGLLDNIPVYGVGNQNVQSNFTPTGNVYAASLSNVVIVEGDLQVPAFTNLTSSQTIVYGTSSIALSGIICAAGGVCPPSGEQVRITINNTPQNVTIGNNGAFSIGTFPTGTIPASQTPYTITYDYPGDSKFEPATDTSTKLTVNKATPSFSNLTSSQTITYGTTSVTLAGTISSPGPVYPPSGELITITINGTPETTPIGANGAFSTTFPTGTIPVIGSPYTITYSYPGDNNFNNATNNGTELIVIKATPSFSNLTSSQTITYGTTSVTLTGTISSPGPVYPPAGELITITINGTPETTPIGANGAFSTTFPTGTIPVMGSPYTITYSYPGDNNFNNATNTSTKLTVTKATTAIALISIPNPSLYLQPVTITMTITSPNGGSPTGTVNFTDNGTSIPGCARVTLVQQSNGSMATCTTSSLTVGTHTQIKASYGGDGNYLGGNSTLNPAQVVNQAPTTTVLASSQNPSIAMQPVTFTATVSSDERPPSGNVTFTSNGNTIPECPNPVPLMLVGTLMKASCITHSLPLGADTILASFTDPQGIFASSSAMLVQTVQAAADFTLLPISPATVIVTQSFTNEDDPFFAQTIHLTAQPLSGYNNTVTLSCSVSPPLSGGSCVVNAPCFGIAGQQQPYHYAHNQRRRLHSARLLHSHGHRSGQQRIRAFDDDESERHQLRYRHQ